MNGRDDDTTKRERWLRDEQTLHELLQRPDLTPAQKLAAKAKLTKLDARANDALYVKGALNEQRGSCTLDAHFIKPEPKTDEDRLQQNKQRRNRLAESAGKLRSELERLPKPKHEPNVRERLFLDVIRRRPRGAQFIRELIKEAERRKVNFSAPVRWQGDETFRNAISKERYRITRSFPEWAQPEFDEEPTCPDVQKPA